MTTIPTKSDEFMSDLRARLGAKYEASETLKSEFTSAEDYAFFALNEPSARGLVRQWKADHDDAENLAAATAAEVRSNVVKADARRAAGRLRVAR